MAFRYTGALTGSFLLVTEAAPALPDPCKLITVAEFEQIAGPLKGAPRSGDIASGDLSCEYKPVKGRLGQRHATGGRTQLLEKAEWWQRVLCCCPNLVKMRFSTLTSKARQICTQRRGAWFESD